MIDTVISQLVEHYRQPVYQDEEAQDYEVLYESSDEAALPPVVKHLLGVLLKNEDDTDDSHHTLTNMVHSYVKLIRPQLLTTSEWGSFRIQSTGVPVLVHFDLLFQCYVNKLIEIESPLEVSSSTKLSDCLELMASDVTILTSSIFRGEEGESTGQRVLANKSLKAMWRLIQGFMKVCSYSPGILSARSMRRLLCSLLGCTKQSIDPQDIEPRLAEQLFRISKSWYHSPTAERDFLEDRLAIEPMDFTVYGSSGYAWMDSQTEATVIHTIWHYLLLSSAEAARQAENVQELGSDEIQMRIMANLKYNEIVKALRAHFFGRDMVNSKSDQITPPPRYELNLGHFEEVTKAQQQAEREKNTMNSKPYEKISSRLHAVLTFLSLMKNSGDSKATRVIIVEFIPICYELLGASNDVAIGKGSILLLHILIMTEFHFRDEEYPKAFLEQVDNLFTALDIVAKTCRDGRTLVLVGSAQRMLLRLLQNKRSDVQMRRRQTTQQWFSILDAAKHRTSEERLVWGLLIVLIPLLYDHIQQENADAMEIGRFGLTALLPIIRLTDTGDFSAHGPQVPLLAVIALSNLVVAAHPMMHKHANKLICELVACLGYFAPSESKASTDSDKEKRLIYLHVTAEVFVVCGSNADRCIARLKEQIYTQTLERCLDDVVNTARSMLDGKAIRY